MNIAEVTITTAAHQLRGYLARPVGGGPRPGVIVLHDAAGMTGGLHRPGLLSSPNGIMSLPARLVGPQFCGDLPAGTSW